MRTRNTNFRGWIGLIRKGSGQVVGVAKLVGCGAPLGADEMIASFEQHRIPTDIISTGTVSDWNTPWHLEGAMALAQPLPYVHKNGAVTFVSLDDAVPEGISAQLGQARPTSTDVIPFAEPRKRKAKAPFEIAEDVTNVIALRGPPAQIINDGRLLGVSTITEGNLKNNHFYLRGFLDAFPPDLIGGRDLSPPFTCAVSADGIETIETDICPRHKFFRDRSWTRRLFQANRVTAGSELAITEIAPRRYKIVVRT